MRKLLALGLSFLVGYALSAVALMVWAGKRLYEEMHAD